MSTVNPKLIDLDFPQIPADRRNSPAIINMPGQSPSSESGAAADVRHLIDQLQQTAWEARSRLRAVEEERDSLAARFQEIQRLNEDLCARAADAASSSLDRDAALREAQRYARVANEHQGRAIQAEKLGQDFKRQRDELAREREELQRNLESLQRAQKTGAQSSQEASGQLLNLRMARDSAQAQIRELTDKLSHAGDEIAELRYRVEDAARATAKADPELMKALQEELDSLRHKHAEASARIPELESALAEARTVPPVAAASSSSESVPNESAELFAQREQVLVQLDIISKEVIVLRQQLQARESEVAAQQLELSDARRRMDELNASIEPLRAECNLIREEREQAITSLSSAQKQIEHIVRERDQIREGHTKQAVELETELERIRAELSQQETQAKERQKLTQELSQAGETLARVEADKHELAQRLEAQRVESIDLATRLDAAQQEIRSIGARLAEARLQARGGGARADESSEKRVVTAPAPIKESRAAASETPEPAGFDGSEALDLIRAMRRCYHAFSKVPDDLSHLNELHCQIHRFGESALAAGYSALHRMVSAFDSFVQELYHFPEQMTSRSLHTIPETIEFFAAVIKGREMAKLRNTDATVYIVEDDALTCECVTMAMESASLRGISTNDSAEASRALAGTACDLILLDIAMPQMDGFELCTAIRGMALHRDTPVVFLSGLGTAENRSKATQVGGNDFIEKPFILCELTLKSLMHIAKSQLKMA